MISLKNVESKIIDNQNLYFFKESEWIEILIKRRLGDIEIDEYVIDRIMKIELPLTKKYPELILAAGIGGFKPFFYSYTFLYGENRYQRIRLSKIKCENCGWEGFIGDPIEPEIYLGIPSDKSRSDLMKNAYTFPVKSCPICNTQFKKVAIWTGELP